MLRRGSKGERVVALQQVLNRLGLRHVHHVQGRLCSEALLEDGLFGAKTEAVIADFQEEGGLPADGIVGPATMAALEAAIARQEVEQSSPGIDAFFGNDQRLAFVRVEADSAGCGYDRFWLRADVAEAYNRARAEIIGRGGIITSSGARRSLQAPVGPGRSALSFHYLGRALDLQLHSGMVDPDSDPFVIQMPPNAAALDEAGQRWFWRVHARCSGAKARGVRQQTLDNVVAYDDPRGARQRSIKGKFISLTECFAEQGLLPIPARPKFFCGGGLVYAEWWHFQYEGGLVPFVSTFGGELLKVYSEETLRESPPWRYRHRVFCESWGFKRVTDEGAEHG